jgi:hypothetical protein
MPPRDPLSRTPPSWILIPAPSPGTRRLGKGQGTPESPGGRGGRGGLSEHPRGTMAANLYPCAATPVHSRHQILPVVKPQPLNRVRQSASRTSSHSREPGRLCSHVPAHPSYGPPCPTARHRKPRPPQPHGRHYHYPSPQDLTTDQKLDMLLRSFATIMDRMTFLETTVATLNTPSTQLVLHPRSTDVEEPSMDLTDLFPYQDDDEPSDNVEPKPKQPRLCHE